jgi:hypothetical protein
MHSPIISLFYFLFPLPLCPEFSLQSGDVPALAWQCVPLTSATAPLPGPRSATTCCLVAGVASGKQQGSAAAPELFCYGGFGDGIERDEMFVINTGAWPNRPSANVLSFVINPRTPSRISAN